MLRYLPYLLLFALWIYAFVDCLGTPEYEVRGMPKVVWVLIILFFGTILLGPLAWLLIGKRRGGRLRTGSRPAGPGPSRLRREHRADPDAPFARGHDRAYEGDDAHDADADRTGAVLERPRQERWIPPDDNPEFLRALGERIKRGGHPADEE